MEVFYEIIKYGALLVVTAQIVVVGRALVLLATEKARPVAHASPAEE